MTIYRGIGGSGEATTDIQVTALAAYATQAQTQAELATTAAGSATASAAAASASAALAQALAGTAPSQTGNAGKFLTTNGTATSWATALTDSAGILNIGSGQIYKDAGGNVGIGTSSPTTKLDVNGNIAGGSINVFGTGTPANGINNVATNALGLFTNSTERARIDSSGNLLVGTTTANGLLTVVGGNTGGTSIQAGFGGTNATSFRIFHADLAGASAALTVAKIERVTSTGRSINAAGTVNASGADYAEYMTKAGDFTVAKGDVVGIDESGKLTNVFANAISFCVKSTAPSYVGGDTWGAELEGAELEVARQTVDRIAFAGQVPVNVVGATAGQYIIPTNDSGAIKGQAVTNPTFEQYQQAVGKVIAIEADGRALIIVKVA